MTTRNPNAEPTLDDLLNAEDFQDQLYSDPKGTLSRVLKAQEQHLEQRFSAHQQAQANEAAIEKNWNRVWRASSDLAENKAWAKEYIADRFANDPQLANGAFNDENLEALIDQAEVELNKKRKREADPSYRDQLVMRGSAEDPVVFDEEPEPEYRLNNIIKSRRARRAA